VYGLPEGSVTLVGHSRKPQPCFAVITAYVAPIAFIEATHCETFKAVGLKDETCDELHETDEPSSQPFQFCSLQPGSPANIRHQYVYRDQKGQPNAVRLTIMHEGRHVEVN
jgi:hypothetical protein